ncbi:MAG: hypothetical protein MUQ30_08845 [Anaerolineae bacterium]|nr:hypothetical protein [Anaerolineae bacterium]
MPGNELAILDPVQNVLRWGVTGLGIVSLIVAVGALLRLLARRWKTRAESLSQQMDRGLASLHHSLARLKSEAAAYPPGIAAPYGPIVQQLQEVIAGIEMTYQSLTDQVTSLGSHPLELPDLAWARIAYWFWHEPRHWWHQRTALGSLTGQLDPPRTEAASARSLLRDLRKQPLDTAERAREVYELVDTAQHTAGLLQTGGVHGAPLDAEAAALKTYRKAFNALPMYLFACTESQIMRRAQPAEIAEAWTTIDALDAKIRGSSGQVAAWHAAYTLAGQELTTMCHCVAAATGCIQEMPDAVDIADLAASWRQTSEEAEVLEARYGTPTTEDLACIDPITQITQTANQVIADVTSVAALYTALESRMAENAERLGQIDRELRQLANAGRYPLDRVPMQVVLDQLTQRTAAIDGTPRPRTGPPRTRPPRTPAQLDADLAAAQVLQQQAQTLVTQVAEARERRRHLIELLDQQAEKPQVDWLGWANDLSRRIEPYAEANWLSGSIPSDHRSGRPSGTAKAAVDADLHVRTIAHDATQLAERQARWLPTHVNEPLVPDELEKRTTELTALFADSEVFQDRLDRISQRFQLCQRVEEKAKSDLATVYGAVDRLDIVTADVLPPTLINEDNNWTQIREQLDLGYEIELALANPGIGTVHETAERVDKWIAATHKILLGWQKALVRETRNAVATLSADLDDLASVAPLDGETAVEQAREIAEDQAGQTRTRKRPHRDAGRRTSASAGVPAGTPVGLSTQLAGDIADQLRTLAHVDQALATLNTAIIAPLTDPVRIWREAEQTAESTIDALQKLEAESANLWPPISCDAARLREECDRANHIRDNLFQDGKTLAQVLETTTTLMESYTAIITTAEQRETTYRAQRSALDNTLDRMGRWCAALERYRDRNAGDPAIASAIRARLDEIEAGWTQLQVRYGQAPGLVPGEEALRTLTDLWLQARREIPLGPGMDVIAAGEVGTDV